MWQIAVTLAVCSGPLAQKRGGHFGYFRQNQLRIAWTSASGDIFVRVILVCVSTTGLECREKRASQVLGIDPGRLWVTRDEFRQMRGKRVQQRRETDLTAGLIDSLCGRRPFSQLADPYLSRDTSHTHLLTHASAQINKQMISPECKMAPHAQWISQIWK